MHSKVKRCPLLFLETDDLIKSNCWDAFMKYPLEKPRSLNVDHTAPLGHQRGAVLALALADDLAVYEHRDQVRLWEPPHIGLTGGK